MSATVSDVLDLDIHGLAIEVWPGVDRTVKMRFPAGTDLDGDAWLFSVPHALGDDPYEVAPVAGESGEEDPDGPRPQLSFTLPGERMRDILRRSFLISHLGTPKISGPIRVANVQAAAGETTVSITLAEPQPLDVSITVAGGAGGGDVFLAVANMFTAAQSIDVDVPVTALADAGTVKPTALVHLHDSVGPRVDLWGSSIDFGGGFIVSSAGRLTRRIGPDGVPTDIYLLESYAFVGVSETTSQPLYRLVMAEVESSDPGELPWLSDLLGVTLAPIRVGEPTEPDDAATKQYVDATVVAVGPTLPPPPADHEKAIWLRTKGTQPVRSMVDFGFFADGLVHGKLTNGTGVSDPLEVISFHTYHEDENDPESPLLPFEPAQVVDGAIQSIMEERVLGPGFALDSLSPAEGGLIAWGFDGYADPDANDLVAYIPTNVAISDAAGNAYLMGVVLGKFVGDTDATDPGEAVSARMKLIRDDERAPHTIATAALPRIPAADDYFWFTFNLDNELAGYMNGTQYVSVTDTTHPVSSLDRIGMPVHQGATPNDWEPCYFARIAWFAISSGDPITRAYGPHSWSEDKGWQPIPAQILPTSGVGLDEAAVQALIDGVTAADVGAPTSAQLADLSGLDPNPTSLAAARNNLGLGGLAVLEAVDTDQIATGAVEAASLDPAVAQRITTSVRCAGDVTRSDTTGGNDPDLKFDAAANTYYRVDIQVQLSGDPTFDAKLGIGAPTGSTCKVALNNFATNIAATSGAEQRSVISALDLAGAVNVGIIASPGVTATLSGWVQTGSTPGEIALWWRPSNTGAVLRHANSYIEHRVVA